MTQSEQVRATANRTVHVLVDTVPHAQPSGVMPGLRSFLELLAKLLPGLAVILAILAFRTEIADYLKHASKVEILGFKLEKEVFDQRVEAARKSGPGASTGDHPRWADNAFRKLNLAAPLLKGMRILWVDDHPENNFYLRKILVDFGVQVVIATSNVEAIDKIKRSDFDLLISDNGRDRPSAETGIEFAREVAVLGYDVPVLFYTMSPQAVLAKLPDVAATSDPAELLSDIAELAVERRMQN